MTSTSKVTSLRFKDSPHTTLTLTSAAYLAFRIITHLHHNHKIMPLNNKTILAITFLDPTPIQWYKTQHNNRKVKLDYHNWISILNLKINNKIQMPIQQQVLPPHFKEHRLKEPLSFISHLFNRKKPIIINKSTAVQVWKITLTSTHKQIKRQFHNNRIPHNRHNHHINHLNMLIQVITFTHLMTSLEQVLPLNKVTNILNHKTKDASHQTT